MFSVRWLLNGALVGLPIGVTLAILFAMSAHDIANGGSGNLWSDNKIVTTTYCQDSIGITPDTDGQQYTLNPNQWGVDSSTTGGLCMNVTTYNNGTYETNTTAPAWSITWKYSQGSSDQPVHAYSNAKIDDVLPDKLSALTNLTLDFEWSYGSGNTSASTTDVTTLTSNGLNANVAMDMFIDSDKTKSSNSSGAAYEVMVWFAAIGAATQAIGESAGAVATETIDGNTFSLYVGTNSLNQNVLTWLPASAVTSFHGDLMPLITKTLSLTGSSYPDSTDYMGYMAIGSEAYYSSEWVTFDVSELAIDIRTS